MKLYILVQHFEDCKRFGSMRFPNTFYINFLIYFREDRIGDRV